MIDFHLALATALDVPALRDLVLRLAGAEAATGDAGPVELPALTISVSAVDHPVTAEVLAEQLGRPATARVGFDVDNKDDADAYAAARVTMAVVAARVAVESDAEACLTFGLEHALLRRQGGVLTVYDWYPEWAYPQVTAALPGPWVVSSEDVRF